jgi:hypothetical protein
MSEHTPGPWKAYLHKNGEFAANIEGKDSRKRKYYIRSVALIMANAEREESLANVRLIAAAPDLLAALERTAHALELAFSQKPLRDMAETLAEAKSVIAKARISHAGIIADQRPDPLT